MDPLARLVSLDAVAMADNGRQPHICHSFLPMLAMASGFQPVPLYRQQMRILMLEGDLEPLWSTQQDPAQDDLFRLVVSRACRDPEVLPTKNRLVAHRELKAECIKQPSGMLLEIERRHICGCCRSCHGLCPTLKTDEAD